MEVLTKNGEVIRKYGTYVGSYSDYCEHVYIVARRFNETFLEAGLRIAKGCEPSVFAMLEASGKSLLDVPNDIKHTAVYHYEASKGRAYNG